MVDDPQIDDNPEWTEQDFARAKPFKAIFPEQYASWASERLRSVDDEGRPKVEVGFRLSADVVEGIKAIGEGYEARVDAVLREALELGKL